MKNIWTLTKIQLGAALDIGSGSRKKRRKGKKTIVASATILYLLFAGISFMYSYAMGTTLQLIGMVELLPELFMAITCMIGFITTIYKVKGILYDFQDFDTVMSLPVHTFEVVCSRLLLLYLINLSFTLVVMIPVSIAYGMLANPSVLYYVFSLVTVFVIPVIPMLLAMIVGALIAIVSSKFRHSNLVNLVITFVFFIGIFIVSFYFGNSEEAIGEMGQYFTEKVDQIYPLAKMYRFAVIENDIVSALILMGESLLFFFLFTWIYARGFKKINTAMTTFYTKNNYKVGALKQGSPFMALYQKEVKRYFSSTLYVLNTGFGVVMMTVCAIATIFFTPESIAQALEVPEISSTFALYVPVILSFCIVLTFTTACSISLEGKNLWILKSAPLTAMTIFYSKIAMNLTITLPAIFLNGLILWYGLKLSVVELAIVLFMPTSYAFFTAIGGLIINLLLPNLNWTTEVTVIKQSAATLVSSLLGMFVAALPIILFYFFEEINPQMILVGVSIVILVLSLVLYQFLIIRGEKLLNSL